jgi:hypothetical protein
MSAIMRSASVVAVLVLSALAGAASATSGASPAKFKPLQGVSLHLGSKHAVGYFHADNGVCQLTLVVGEELKGDVSPAVASARFRTAIEAGRYARFDIGEGTQLQFSCAPGATVMTVETLKQIAYTAPQK